MRNGVARAARADRVALRPVEACLRRIAGPVPPNAHPRRHPAPPREYGRPPSPRRAGVAAGVAADQPNGSRTSDVSPAPRVVAPLPMAFQTSTRTVPPARFPYAPDADCSPAAWV